MSDRTIIGLALAASALVAVAGFVALTELDHLIRVWAVRKHARKRKGWL